MSPTHSNSTDELTLGTDRVGVGCILRVRGTFCLACYFEKGCNKGEITHEKKNKRRGRVYSSLAGFLPSMQEALC